LRSEVLQRWSERDWPRAGAAWTRLMRLTGRRDDVFEYFDLVTPSSRYKEAHRQLSEVAERWPSLADDPRFGIRWAGLQRRLEDYEGSLRSVRRARRQARALGDRGIVQRTWLAESVALYSLGRLDESEAAAAEARRMAVELHAPGKLAKVLRQQGNLSMARGDGRRAEELLRRARKLSLATRDRDAAGWCANSLAILAMHRGELATARRYYEETLAVQESRADEFGIVLVRGNLSEALALEGDLGAAEEEAAKVLSRAQTLDISPQLEYQALARLGRVAVERGDADAAERFLARADERGPEDLTNQVEVRFLRARMYLLRGDVQAATAAVGESLELATEKRFALLRLDALAVRGEVEEARGDLEAAVATYHRVVEEAEAVEARIILGYTLPRLGRALRRLGRSDEARRVLDRALEVQAGTGQILETAHSRYELAELELAAGRREHAAAVARQALADADEAGDADRWAEIRDLLRRLGARDEPPLRLAATAEGRR
jgi:tetratricopeptide (TPR) repeat protein